MLAYAMAIVAFVIQILVSNLFAKWIKPLKEKDIKIKEQMDSHLSEYEKECNITPIGIFRLRMLGLFAKMEDENKKEEIREKMKNVVKEQEGKPMRLLSLHFLSVLSSVLFIYFLIFFFNSEPIFWLGIIVNILVMFFWISRKRWFFSLIFGLVGFYLYPKMSGHLVFYIGLNMIKFIIQYSKVIKNKKSE
ncbi:hypothetical protein [Bacillus cereus]|uniref:hypothetical protein n=1 Tax=Bacillus cereus TaxID=1396 RepID=UPI000B4B5398|nr:hypothetical protein [Bacillus cereus]